MKLAEVTDHFNPRTVKLQDLYESRSVADLIREEGGEGLVSQPDFFRGTLSSLTGLSPHNSPTLKTVRLNYKGLTSLEGCPGVIYGSLDCSNNFLTSFEGAPSLIGGSIYANNNNFTDLKNIHKHITRMFGTLEVGGLKMIRRNVLGVLLIEGCTNLRVSGSGMWTWERIINKHLKKDPKERSIYDCQAELIEEGYPEYAEL